MPIIWHITPQGFLVEEKLLSLLAPLEKEEQTVVKLASLLTVSSCSVMHQWIV